MKLSEITQKPQLIEVVLNDAELVEEFGEELERVSATTGKVRKGKKLSAKDIEQLLKTRPSNFPELE